MAFANALKHRLSGNVSQKYTSHTSGDSIQSMDESHFFTPRSVILRQIIIKIQKHSCTEANENTAIYDSILGENPVNLRLQSILKPQIHEHIQQLVKHDKILSKFTLVFTISLCNKKDFLLGVNFLFICPPV